jgi:hypothetical protein
MAKDKDEPKFYYLTLCLYQLMERGVDSAHSIQNSALSSTILKFGHYPTQMFGSIVSPIYIGDETNSDFYQKTTSDKGEVILFLSIKRTINIVITHYIVYDDICLMVREINYFIYLFILFITVFRGSDFRCFG